MPLDSETIDTKDASPVMWLGLAALVVVLGALAVFLMGCNQVLDLNQTVVAVPNYYDCTCECTQGFSLQAVVSPAPQFSTLNVFTAAGSTSVKGSVPGAAEGQIVSGPMSALFQGNMEWWWEVNFTTNVTTPVQGWVAQPTLEVISSAVLGDPKVLNVCLKPEWNPRSPQFTGDPSPATIGFDCSRDRVQPRYAQITGQQLPAGSTCACTATAFPSQEEASCNGTPCDDPSGVCLVAGSDPDPPVPDQLSAAVFVPTSVCVVEDGAAQITVNGHTPKTQPKVRGTVLIHGTPCVGQGSQPCHLGISYQLRSDDVEFDSGSIFASDPKFVDLHFTGATVPGSINMGYLLFYIGDVQPGTAYTTGQGRRSTQTTPIVLTGRNTQSLALGVSFGPNGSCNISGPLIGEIVSDDDGDLTMTAEVQLPGFLVNQPPHPDGSATTKTVECTSPQGALVTLNASASTDPDDNIAQYSWRRGAANATDILSPSVSPILKTQQALGETEYFVQVSDTKLAADIGSVKVEVVDTTPPVVSCNSPLTIRATDAPISFTATADDLCGAPSTTVQSYKCFEVKKDGRIEDRTQWCKVATQGSTFTIYNPGGVGTTIQWTLAATDASGNLALKSCEVFVTKP
jgi:hypothetical protein